MTLPGVGGFLFQPRRISVVGGPSSKSQFLLTPFSSLPETTTRACGFVHSRRTTSPVTVIDLLESYSAANEWCAFAGAAAASASVENASVATRSEERRV